MTSNLNSIVEIYEIKYNKTEQELKNQFDKCLDAKVVNNATFQAFHPGETVTANVLIEFGAIVSYFIVIRAIGTRGTNVKYV